MWVQRERLEHSRKAEVTGGFTRWPKMTSSLVSTRGLCWRHFDDGAMDVLSDGGVPSEFAGARHRSATHFHKELAI